MTTDLSDLQKRQEQFIATRDWEHFHAPKSVAMALSVEAAELVEIFQWHDNLPAEAYEDQSELRDEVEEELADVLIYSLSMASLFEIDLANAVDAKLDENERRFDASKSATIREDLSRWKRGEHHGEE